MRGEGTLEINAAAQPRTFLSTSAASTAPTRKTDNLVRYLNAEALSRYDIDAISVEVLTS